MGVSECPITLDHLSPVTLKEPPDVVDGAPAPPKGWPTSGALQFDRVTATDRHGLPPVLRDVSFELKVRTSQIVRIY